MKASLPYTQAHSLATKLIDRFATNCERIELAGSLRRRKSNRAIKTDRGTGCRNSSFGRRRIEQGGGGQGGWMPDAYQVDEARVWCDGQALSTPEEEDVFRLWGMEFVEPEFRTGDYVPVFVAQPPKPPQVFGPSQFIDRTAYRWLTRDECQALFAEQGVKA